MFHMSLKPSIIETIPLLRKSEPKVWIEAYGCSASMADSEMISGLLKEAAMKLQPRKVKVPSTSLSHALSKIQPSIEC